MNLKPIPKQGTTHARKGFWDAAREAVFSAQKIAGRNVTVSEHEGKGSVINVPDRTRAAPTPVSCDCPVATLHVGVTGSLTVADNRQCPDNCGSNDCSISVDADLSSSADTSEICNEFGWNDIILSRIPTTGDFTGSCGAVGSLTPTGSIEVDVGTTLLGDGTTDCHGTVDVTVFWFIKGLHLSTFYCGDNPGGGCNNTTWTTTESFPVSNFHEPSGTYSMSHTLTASGYSATAAVTAVIS